MKNIIVFSDLHLRLTPKKRRIDNMFEAQLEKLRWIGQRAKELKSSAVICTGDLGDQWDWKISTVNKIADIFINYPCPVLSVMGNHDIPGKNLSLWKDSGIGALHNHKNSNFTIFNPEDKWDYAYNYKKYIGEGICITGYHSDSPSTAKLISNLPTLDDANFEGLSVAIVHAPVGPVTTPWCIGHKELLISEFDVAIFGDIHPGWEPHTSKAGCVITNPGSLTRLDSTDIDRKPKIVVIWANAKVEYEVVPHKPASEVFDLLGIEDKYAELGKGFLAAIAAKNIKGDLNPKQYVEELGKASGYSDKAIKILQGEL